MNEHVYEKVSIQLREWCQKWRLKRRIENWLLSKTSHISKTLKNLLFN